jgi:hypothetical protein
MRRLAEKLGLAANVASMRPDICVPIAVRLPSNEARWSLPLKAPWAASPPRPVCGRPVATDTKPLASCASSAKLARSKANLSPSTSEPVARAVAPAAVTDALRRVSASIVPATLPPAVEAPSLPFKNFGMPA